MVLTLLAYIIKVGHGCSTAICQDERCMDKCPKYNREAAPSFHDQEFLPPVVIAVVHLCVCRQAWRKSSTRGHCLSTTVCRFYKWCNLQMVQHKGSLSAQEQWQHQALQALPGGLPQAPGDWGCGPSDPYTGGLHGDIQGEAGCCWSSRWKLQV